MPDETQRGEITVVGKGSIGVLKGGFIAVLNKRGECENCCPIKCTPYVLATKTTNQSNPTWDLTPYQGKGIAKKRSAAWRLIERGHGLQYGNGEVNRDRQLVGLPNEFRTGFSYDGYMELQIACRDKNDRLIWP